MTAPDPTPRPLDHLARRGRGEDVALVAGKESLTYAELDAMVGRTARALFDRGLQAGDRVASWMGKTVLACVLPLAAARAGLVHVPINPVLKRAQAEHILADSGAKLLIGNRARIETIEGVDRLALEDWSAEGDPIPASDRDPDELCALLYTSGSTGRAKGVMLSHANLWLGAVSVAHYLGLGRDERTLCVLPLAFDYGQNQLFSTWYAGGTAIALDYLLANDLKKAVRRHDVTVLAGVPPLWHQLAALDWSGGEGASLRTLTNSGGHVPEPLVRQLRTLFPKAKLYLMYGLTEAFRSTYLDPALVDAHPDSIGSAIPFAEIRVMRPDGTEAAPGEEGELVHAGPLVAKGYWNDPERTAQRFRNGEVWSGDTVVRAADGMLRFRGRDDAMIKVSGNRLSPTEVEEAALASGAASEAAAFGIPDPLLGEAVVLVAVGAGRKAEDRLRAHFAAECPAYMAPRRIVFVDKMPLGPNGKVDRVALKARLEAEAA